MLCSWCAPSILGGVVTVWSVTDRSSDAASMPRMHFTALWHQQAVCCLLVPVVDRVHVVAPVMVAGPGHTPSCCGDCAMGCRKEKIQTVLVVAAGAAHGLCLGWDLSAELDRLWCDDTGRSCWLCCHLGASWPTTYRAGHRLVQCSLGDVRSNGEVNCWAWLSML